MVRKRVVTNEELNAQLISLTKLQKKTLLGLAKAAGAGGKIASVQVVREPTSTGLTKSKKKKNAEARQTEAGGKGTSEFKPRRSKRNKGGGSAWIHKVNEAKTAFPLVEGIGVPAVGSSRVRRVGMKKNLKERTAAATNKTKAALVLNKAKASRQATIAAKRKSFGLAGFNDAAPAIQKKGETPKEKAVNRKKKKRQEKKAKVAAATANKKVQSEKWKAIEPEQLEMQMNTYWFEAGKGKDPKEMKLDSTMDEYWSKKPPLVPQDDVFAAVK